MYVQEEKSFELRDFLGGEEKSSSVVEVGWCFAFPTDVARHCWLPLQTLNRPDKADFMCQSQTTIGN